jgi:hypothetical protein
MASRGIGVEVGAAAHEVGVAAAGGERDVRAAGESAAWAAWGDEGRERGVVVGVFLGVGGVGIRGWRGRALLWLLALLRLRLRSDGGGGGGGARDLECRKLGLGEAFRCDKTKKHVSYEDESGKTREETGEGRETHEAESRQKSLDRAGVAHRRK